MTLAEILSTISLKYPHSYTDDDVVSILNRIQAELFRTLYKPESYSQFDIIADTAFYAIDFSPEKIIEVVVNDCELKRDNIRSKSLSEFYYILENDLVGIYPTPTEDIENGMTIFHYAEPTVLTVEETSAAPDFDKDWHMILVYRACKELAEYDHNDDFVNVFVSQINGIEDEYKRTKIHQPYEIQNVFGGCLL